MSTRSSNASDANCGAPVPEPTPSSWRGSADLWRTMRRFDLRSVDLAFRVLGGGRMPAGTFSRVHNFGIPADAIEQTLRSIHSLSDWSREWVETAQGFMGTSRRETSAGNSAEAERARYIAAMCYHAAQILEIRDLRTRDNCRAWTASLVKQSLPVVRPHARHMRVGWRDQQLPILFELPAQAAEPYGLVVIFNGISQSKEENILLAPRFLNAGYAVLAIDSPGTGEATSLGPLTATATDMLDAVLAELRQEPAIDLQRLVLVGGSFGGNDALRIASRIPELMAVVTVTPAVNPSPWMNYASSIMWAELEDAVGDNDPRELATTFDVSAAAAQLTVPLLVYGAGHDAVVPPNESQKLAASVGERATLVWYPDLGHCLYAAQDQWTAEAVAWIEAIAAAKAAGEEGAAALSTVGREAIESFNYQPDADRDGESDEDFTEFARLLPASDTTPPPSPPVEDE